MVSSRTGLTPHLRFRKAVLRRDHTAGVTHCPMPGCGKPLDYDVSKRHNSAEPDHIVPISMGGTNHPDNGRTICRQCNQSRGNRDAPRPRCGTPEAVTTNLISW